MTVRTILRMLAREGCEQDFVEAWGRAAAVIAAVPGQQGQQLMRESGDEPWFAIVSDWSSREAVDAFGRSAARETLTEALRDLRRDAARSTYQVLATVAARPQHPVRVEITTTAGAGEGEELEAAWLAVAPHIQAARGNALESLARHEGDDGSDGPDDAGAEYRIASEWAGEDDFGAWLADPEHAVHGEPMGRWYAHDFRKEVFHVRASVVRDSSFAPVGAARGAAPEAVRVEISTVVPAADQEEFEAAWAAVAAHVEGSRGNLLEQLLRSEDGTAYRLCSEWASAADHLASMEDPVHRELVGPMMRWLSQSFSKAQWSLRQTQVRDGAYRPLVGAGAVSQPAPAP